MLELLEKVQSKTDNVTKYVFQEKSYFNEMRPTIIEFSYIDNGTGKDIICVSTQSMCAMGCKFCHCTDHLGKIPVKDTSADTIFRGVKYIIDDLKEIKNVLLISYMGCGEPFNVLDGEALPQSMKWITNTYKDKYKVVRFAVSTCLPQRGVDKFFKFTRFVKDSGYPVKLHLSLHYTRDGLRKQWMPNSLDISSSIAACKFYKEYTGNDVEMHYTLIEGLNDSDFTALELNCLLANTGFNLKIIRYNEKDTLDYKRSKAEEDFAYWLTNVNVEFYTPPGIDVGSSCGQFLFETYDKWYKKWQDENKDYSVRIIH